MEHVRFLSRLDRPDELIARGGLLGGRLELVRAGDILEVLPRERRILVRGDPA